ncbi:hypothetical protein [Nonomuraea sp. LPB2021202275-12-8]|uniref:hypothetical protein n=1 Tax=Nonomuraea sp. LPB2021202275-12-8 TaxID=3120159 RepID=UPI00300D5916
MAEDVAALLREADAMPYGEARTVLVERALRAAEAGDDHDLVIRARLDLAEAYQYGGEPVKVFATFSRNLADYDAEPGRWDRWVTHELLWQFKWVVANMRQFPQIPLRRTLDALDEMERRYRQAGDMTHAVHAKRCFTASHLGDDEGMREWFHRWQTSPRDELSDCEACDTSSKVWALASLGRDEDAVAAAKPVVEGRSTCAVQPQNMLITVLLPYVRTGRLEQAAQAHRRAYRIVRGQPSHLEDIGTHLEFCALTGNETRGLEILQRELPLLERPPSPSQERTFQEGAALLLRRLEETGHGHLTVRRAGRDVPVPELRAAMEAGARRISAEFDARNGNDTHSRQTERRLAARPLVARLPLFPHHRASSTGSPHDNWRRGVAALDQAASRDHDAGPAVRELAEAVAGFTERGDTAGAALARVDLARAYLAAGRALDAAETAEEAVTLLDRADGTAPAAARRTLAAAQHALGEYDRQLATLRRLGDPAALMDMADDMNGRDEDRQAAGAYAAAADLFEAAGDLLAAGRALTLHATSVHYAGDDRAGIAAAFDRARAALTAAGKERAARELALLAYEEADVLRWQDEHDRAAELAREAADAFTALGDEDDAELARDLLRALGEDD